MPSISIVAVWLVVPIVRIWLDLTRDKPLYSRPIACAIHRHEQSIPASL